MNELNPYERELTNYHTVQFSESVGTPVRLTLHFLRRNASEKRIGETHRRNALSRGGLARETERDRERQRETERNALSRGGLAVLNAVRPAVEQLQSVL